MATKTSKSQKDTKGVSGTVKKAKVQKAELDTKNIKNTIKKVVETNREIKYKYPEGMVDTLKRKTFRQVARNKIKSLTASAATAEGNEKAKLEKELKAYRKEVLLVP